MYRPYRRVAENHPFHAVPSTTPYDLAASDYAAHADGDPDGGSLRAAALGEEAAPLDSRRYVPWGPAMIDFVMLSLVAVAFLVSGRYVLACADLATRPINSPDTKE